MKKLVVGAVAYDPKVVPIWEGIREYLCQDGLAMDFVLFSNYEAQVEALFDRFIDIAWNTNLAFVRTDLRLKGKSKVLCMRDTDLGFKTKMIVPATSSAKTLADLRGKRIALGSRDSVQAAIMPEHCLRQEGLKPDTDYKAVRFNTDVGKHGDTGRSEWDVLKAIRTGEADAGAVGEPTWLMVTAGGDAGDLKTIWTSPGYSHCNFTALPDIENSLAESFVQSLLKMDYNNPEHRRILEMEGLKQWIRGEREGYESVFASVESTGYLKAEQASCAK
jgi:ABC-type phosphate/phosphonate transport system substrate-binding protein